MIWSLHGPNLTVWRLFLVGYRNSHVSCPIYLRLITWTRVTHACDFDHPCIVPLVLTISLRLCHIDRASPNASTHKHSQTTYACDLILIYWFFYFTSLSISRFSIRVGSTNTRMLQFFLFLNFIRIFPKSISPPYGKNVFDWLPDKGWFFASYLLKNDWLLAIHIMKLYRTMPEFSLFQFNLKWKYHQIKASQNINQRESRFVY